MMPRVQTPPPMLMLSHCMPAADGDAERARAWQLLRMASRTHQVYLRCLADGPINLDQWRSLLPHVQRASIATGQRWTRPGMSWLGQMTRRQGQRDLRARLLDEGVRHWPEEQAYDAVLCTHSALWTAANHLPTRLRICDLLTDASQQLATLHDADAASTLITLSNSAERIDTGLAHAVVPMAIDTQQLHVAHSVDSFEANRLILGVGGNWHDSRQALGWFQKRVWPLVHRMVPRAMLDVLDLSKRGNPQGVGVHPLKDATHGRWSVMRAMACGQPTVASQAAAEQLGAQSGEHLLTAEHDQDWAHQCIQALRSAELRLSLSQQGRAFVKTHHDIAQTPWPLSPTIRNDAMSNPPAKRAA